MSSQEQALDGDGAQWRGTTAGERAGQRRGRLMEAALRLVAAEGATSVTVRAVVRESGLSPRFFYESFEDRDALLLAVWDEQYADVVAHVEDAIATADDDFASRLRAALVATAHWLDEQPSRPVLMLRESLAEPLLRDHARRRLPELVRSTMTMSVGADAAASLPSVALDIAVVAMSGAIVNLFLEWTAGHLPVTAERLADAIVLVSAASMAHLQEF